MPKILAAVFVLAILAPIHAQALDNDELLALVAMPLAVAAVSEVTDVPMSDLIDVVTLMNDAAVPPAQFIEVVRYVPVALVVQTDEPRFVDFLQAQYDNGLRGPTLVSSIEDRFHLYGINGVDLDVTTSRVVDVTDDFIPVAVRNRVAEARSHPHGGPPGQLKKERGVQTGAEIVHGSKPGRRNDSDRVVTKRHDRGDDDRGRGQGKDKDKDKGNGKGKGKGKG